MSPVEWIAAGLGLANVWLVVRRSIWNFPAALAMCALYLWIFYDARLYSDALLQIFFIIINLYGWAAWLRNRAEDGEIRVERLTPLQRGVTVGLAVLVSLVWGTAMARLTDATHPYWDGTIAIASIASQVLLARRKLENWAGWIFVNLISIPLYALKGLYPTTILYVILLALAVIGLLEWRGKLRQTVPL